MITHLMYGDLMTKPLVGNPWHVNKDAISGTPNPTQPHIVRKTKEKQDEEA